MKRSTQTLNTLLEAKYWRQIHKISYVEKLQKKHHNEGLTWWICCAENVQKKDKGMSRVKAIRHYNTQYGTILKKGEDKYIYLYTGTQRYCNLEPWPPGVWRVQQVQMFLFYLEASNEIYSICLNEYFVIGLKALGVLKRSHASETSASLCTESEKIPSICDEGLVSFWWISCGDTLSGFCCSTWKHHQHVKNVL